MGPSKNEWEKGVFFSKMHHCSEVLILLVCFYRGLCFMETETQKLWKSLMFPFCLCTSETFCVRTKRLMTHSFERYRVLWDPMFSTQNYAFVSCQCSWQHIVCTMKILVSCEKFKYKIRTSSGIVKLVQIKKCSEPCVVDIFLNKN